MSYYKRNGEYKLDDINLTLFWALTLESTRVINLTKDF